MVRGDGWPAVLLTGCQASNPTTCTPPDVSLQTCHRLEDELSVLACSVVAPLLSFQPICKAVKSLMNRCWLLLESMGREEARQSDTLEICAGARAVAGTC